MISYIKGKVDKMLDSAVIVECSNIGYLINVSSNTLSKLSNNNEVKMYTYMQVKEDGISLYGFLTNEEIEMFNLLLNVRGLGPKSALSMLNVSAPSKIMLAIITDDFDTLSKAPGVGKKTAQRIVLDLKDKIKTHDAVANMAVSNQESINISGGSSAKQDAVDALITLGYTRSEAVKAVMEVAVEGMDTEQIIKSGLKKLI